MLGHLHYITLRRSPLFSTSGNTDARIHLYACIKVRAMERTRWRKGSKVRVGLGKERMDRYWLILEQRWILNWLSLGVYEIYKCFNSPSWKACRNSVFTGPGWTQLTRRGGLFLEIGGQKNRMWNCGFGGFQIDRYIDENCDVCICNLKICLGRNHHRMWLLNEFNELYSWTMFTCHLTFLKALPLSK